MMGNKSVFLDLMWIILLKFPSQHPCGNAFTTQTTTVHKDSFTRATATGNDFTKDIQNADMNIIGERRSDTWTFCFFY